MDNLEKKFRVLTKKMNSDNISETKRNKYIEQIKKLKLKIITDIVFELQRRIKKYETMLYKNIDIIRYTEIKERIDNKREYVFDNVGYTRFKKIIENFISALMLETDIQIKLENINIIEKKITDLSSKGNKFGSNLLAHLMKSVENIKKKEELNEHQTIVDKQNSTEQKVNTLEEQINNYKEKNIEHAKLIDTFTQLLEELNKKEHIDVEKYSKGISEVITNIETLIDVKNTIIQKLDNYKKSSEEYTLKINDLEKINDELRNKNIENEQIILTLNNDIKTINESKFNQQKKYENELNVKTEKLKEIQSKKEKLLTEIKEGILKIDKLKEQNEQYKKMHEKENTELKNKKNEDYDIKTNIEKNIKQIKNYMVIIDKALIKETNNINKLKETLESISVDIEETDTERKQLESMMNELKSFQTISDEKNTTLNKLIEEKSENTKLIQENTLTIKQLRTSLNEKELKNSNLQERLEKYEIENKKLMHDIRELKLKKTSKKCDIIYKKIDTENEINKLTSSRNEYLKLIDEKQAYKGLLLQEINKLKKTLEDKKEEIIYFKKIKKQEELKEINKRKKMGFGKKNDHKDNKLSNLFSKLRTYYSEKIIRHIDHERISSYDKYFIFSPLTMIKELNNSDKIKLETFKQSLNKFITNNKDVDELNTFISETLTINQYNDSSTRMKIFTAIIMMKYIFLYNCIQILKGVLEATTNTTTPEFKIFDNDKLFKERLEQIFTFSF